MPDSEDRDSRQKPSEKQILVALDVLGWLYEQSDRSQDQRAISRARFLLSELLPSF